MVRRCSYQALCNSGNSPETSMSKMSVFWLSTSRTQANEIVSQLRAADFFRGEISVLFPYQGTLPEFAVEKYSKTPRKLWNTSSPEHRRKYFFNESISLNQTI